MAFDAILFDLDGTLVSTLPDLTDAANDMLIELGMATIDDATIATLVGKGEHDFIVKLLRHSQVHPNTQALTEARAIYQRKYDAINGRKAVVFDGVMAGLDMFAQQTDKLAVVTNKSTAFTAPLLRQLGLLDYFSIITCGDTYTHAKPDPMPLLKTLEKLDSSPQQALMIGDSISDALAAQAASMPMLALPYGYNEGASVHDLPATAIVKSLVEAAQWARDNPPKTP